MAGFVVVGHLESLLDPAWLAWPVFLFVIVALFLPDRVRRRDAKCGPRAAVGLLLSIVVCGIGLRPGQAWAADAESTKQVIRVGLAKPIKTIAQAAQIAKNGALVEVDSGEYASDVAVWTQDRLTIRAVGGRVRLNSQGAAAEGKAIWVVRGKQFSVEGFDFFGAKVPDRNGAGIRLESGSMRVYNCRFIGNETGILTSNRSDVELDVVDSEFGHNGFGDGQTHNLYVGSIARLSVTGSYFHHAIAGHLLKTRAAVNDIRYSRLADGPGGRASYELEFPNGGVAYVVGNIIEQGVKTENPYLISYGAEGYRWPHNALYLIHNTLVDKKPGGGVLLRVRPGEVTIKAVNNLVAGGGRLETAGPGDYRNNVNVDWSAFASNMPDEYRLKRDVRFGSSLVDPGAADGVALQPELQHQQPVGAQALTGKPHNPGALQPSRP